MPYIPILCLPCVSAAAGDSREKTAKISAPFDTMCFGGKKSCISYSSCRIAKGVCPLLESTVQQVIYHSFGVHSNHCVQYINMIFLYIQEGQSSAIHEFMLINSLINSTNYSVALRTLLWTWLNTHYSKNLDWHGLAKAFLCKYLINILKIYLHYYLRCQ